jgi:hypothetical protein
MPSSGWSGKIHGREGGDPGVGTGAQPVRDAAGGAEQGGAVEELRRRGLGGLAQLSGQIELLHLLRLAGEAGAGHELVVEVLAPRAHAAHVVRGVGADPVRAVSEVGADGDRHRRDDVEVLQFTALAGGSGAQLRHGLVPELGPEEDAEPAVRDLAGQACAGRADGREVEG